MPRAAVLRSVVAPHNAYYFWRRGPRCRGLLGVPPTVLSNYFSDSRPLGAFDCRDCAIWRPDLPIFVSYGDVPPIEELLSDWRHFGIDAAPALLPKSDT